MRVVTMLHLAIIYTYVHEHTFKFRFRYVIIYIAEKLEMGCWPIRDYCETISRTGVKVGV
jgi:hypothetical protein